MSHKAQRRFCEQVRKKFPDHFKRVKAVDVGSLHINGNNRYLFSRTNYTGIDIMPGENVDEVGLAHEAIPRLRSKQYSENWRPGTNTPWLFDTMICTGTLEHDKHIVETLNAMYDNLKSGGLLLVTAAGEGWEEHGTTRSKPEDSPATNDYYMNVSITAFSSILPPNLFIVYHIEHTDNNLFFYGIKK